MSGNAVTVTVSRQMGAGATPFCLELSRRLGLPIFDHQILTQLATEMHTSEEVVDTYEKMRYGAQEFVLTPFATRYAFLAREIIESSRYMASVRKVMKKAVELGGAIILGRGGQCILGDRPHCLHLRVVAEEDQRLERLAARQEHAEHSRRELRQLMRQVDRERRAFVKKHFRREIDDPLLYHLVLNFSLLTQEEALDVVECLVRKG